MQEKVENVLSLDLKDLYSYAIKINIFMWFDKIWPNISKPKQQILVN